MSQLLPLPLSLSCSLFYFFIIDIYIGTQKKRRVELQCGYVEAKGKGF